MSGTPPVVAVVGANNITASSANLAATVNPQGLAGTWWFAYGTGSLDAQTPSQAIGATSIPQTVTTTLTGLETAVSYQYAVVCETSAGTVTSIPATFTPGAPATNTTVTPELVAVPHFAYPFTMTAQGAVMVEQDSYEDVLSCVRQVVAVPAGTCPDLPAFGRPDLTFQGAPPSPAALVAAIQAWEPRADETTVVAALDQSGADWAIQLASTVTGT